jgi:hypothetical protein
LLANDPTEIRVWLVKFRRFKKVFANSSWEHLARPLRRLWVASDRSEFTSSKLLKMTVAAAEKTSTSLPQTFRSPFLLKVLIHFCRAWMTVSVKL